MPERRAIEIVLLFSAFFLLTTCQLQLNNNGNNGLTFQILLPPSGSQTLATNARSLAGGTSVTVTVTQGSTTWASSGLIAIGGKTSVNYTFTMPPAGMYQVSANLLDGSGNILATASTTFTIPTQTNPVVLTMTTTSANLASATLVASPPSSGPTTYAFVPAFSPTVYIYSSTSPEPQYAYPPTLTLTTVDPNATFSVTETVPSAGPYTLLPAGSPSGSSCTLNFSADYSPATLTIVVTASNGITTQTYTITIPFSLG